jgi:hypothetical protein
MNKRKFYSECEFCGEFRVSVKDDTVCNDCDAQMKRDQEMGFKLREAAWGETHRCRDCAAPLPRSRYFQCMRCLPEASRELAWEFETIDSPEESEQKVILRTEKACKECKATKPLEDFPISNECADGRRGKCRACCAEKYRLSSRAGAERRRQKLAELKAGAA